jgi:type IV secretion system protein VirD4
MQLPPTDEIVMVSGVHPIRARKVRYFKDRRFKERILPPPVLDQPQGATDDWSALKPVPPPPQASAPPAESAAAKPQTQTQTENPDEANAGIRREPALPDHVAMVKEPAPPPKDRKTDPSKEFTIIEDEPDAEAQRAQVLRQRMRGAARQVALDPDDGIDL